MGPALVAPLVPPEGSEEFAQDRPGDPPAPQGKATVYDAYDNRVDLIVWVSGLSPGQTYEVWASGDGASRRLEALTIDEQGRGSVAYPTDSQTTWDAIEVRGVDGKAVLTGELRPREPGAGDW